MTSITHRWPCTGPRRVSSSKLRVTSHEGEGDCGIDVLMVVLMCHIFVVIES
jgi:hypothetical protein